MDANTVIEQLGGKRIFAMAFESATHDDTSVTFRIARGLARSMGKHKVTGRKPTHVRVTLEPSDTYTVEVLSVNVKADEMVVTNSSLPMVYGDQLAAVVEMNTGLRLSL